MLCWVELAILVITEVPVPFFRLTTSCFCLAIFTTLVKDFFLFLLYFETLLHLDSCLYCVLFDATAPL